MSFGSLLSVVAGQRGGKYGHLKCRLARARKRERERERENRVPYVNADVNVRASGG